MVGRAAIKKPEIIFTDGIEREYKRNFRTKPIQNPSLIPFCLARVFRPCFSHKNFVKIYISVGKKSVIFFIFNYNILKNDGRMSLI